VEKEERGILLETRKEEGRNGYQNPDVGGAAQGNGREKKSASGKMGEAYHPEGKLQTSGSCPKRRAKIFVTSQALNGENQKKKSHFSGDKNAGERTTSGREVP